jgi:hypothetical protein
MAHDDRNHATRRRHERQEALRDYLSNRGKLDHVLDNIEKMESEGGEMEAQQLTAIKYATDARVKLLNKYLPDLRHTELAGDPDSPLLIDIVNYADSDS